MSTSGDIGSYLSELGLYIIDPNGDGAYISEFLVGDSWTGTESVGPLTFTGAGPLIAGNCWHVHHGFL